MIHILGQTGVVMYHHLRMWAERGLIRIEDTRSGQYNIITRREALERLQGISDMVGNSLDDSFSQFYDQIRYEQRGIEAILELCRQAKDQGEPSNPQARRDLAARRPLTTIVPYNKFLHGD